MADIRRALDPIAARDGELRYEIEIPPPARFKGRRRLVMDPLDVFIDAPIVQAVARSYRTVTGGEDDACVLVSEMEKVTRVLAVTALDVFQRKPAELAMAFPRS